MATLSSVGHARNLFDPPNRNTDWCDVLIEVSDRVGQLMRSAYESCRDCSFWILRIVKKGSSHEQCAALSKSSAQTDDIKIHCISDTHNCIVALHDKTVDLLIHCGDLTEAGTKDELVNTLNWLESLTIKHKIFIGGNHDFALEKMSLEQIAQTWPSLTYLNDSSAKLIIKGRPITIFGTPRTPRYGGFTAFSYSSQDEPFVSFNDNADIIVSHGPPYGYVDTIGTKHAGCHHLREFVKRIRPNLLVCGHIHVAGGSVESVILDEVEECRQQQGWLSALRRAWQAPSHSAPPRATVFANCAVADSSKAKSGLSLMYRR